MVTLEQMRAVRVPYKAERQLTSFCLFLCSLESNAQNKLRSGKAFLCLSKMQKRLVSLEGTEEHNVLPDERLPDKTIFWSGKMQPKQIAIAARPAGSSIR